eukprot:Pgem_evm2s15283
MKFTSACLLSAFFLGHNGVSAMNTYQQDAANCNLIADIVYLFDQSGSIGWDKNNNNVLNLGQERMLDMQEFVQFVNDEISIGAKQSHAAFAEFNVGYTQRTDFRGPGAYSKATLTEELFKMEYTTAENKPNMRTHLGGALRQIDYGVFKTGRKGVPKIIVTLTDGDANDEDPNDYVTKVAPKLRAEGYTILAVAIGKVKQQGLMDLTGNSKNIFKVGNFKELKHKIQQLSKRICETPPPQKEQDDSCDLIADVAYLFDQSGSIGWDQNGQNNLKLGQARVKEMLMFVNKVNKELSVSNDQAHIAFSEFNTEYTPIASFSSDATKVKTNLNKLEYTERENQPNMRTFLGTALKKMDSGLFKSARAGVPKIIVTLTDGDANDEKFGDPQNAVSIVAPKLREDGYIILAVAIGNIKEQGLLELTGDPSNIFKVSDFSQLESRIQDLSKKLCSLNCETSEWAEWSTCELPSDNSNNANNTCGMGSRSTSRVVTKESAHNGLKCPALDKTEECEIPCAPPPPVEPPVAEQNPPSSNAGAIAGGVIGGLAALAGIGAAAYMYNRNVANQSPDFENIKIEHPSDNNPLFQNGMQSHSNPIAQ